MRINKYLQVFAPALLSIGFIWILFTIRLSYPQTLENNGVYDEGWYAELITEGYSFNGDVTTYNNIVFFPVYPLLSRLVLQVVGGQVLEAMFLTSWLFVLVGIYGLFLLVQLSYSYKIALLTCLLFLASPFSFFLTFGYTESVFFAGIFWFMYTLEKKMDIWPLLIVAVLSATRLYGILLLVVYVFEKWHYRPNAWRYYLWIMPIGTLGLGSFIIFQYWQFGDPLLFLYNQVAWGHKSNNSLLYLVQFKEILPTAISGITTLKPMAIAAVMFMGAFFTVLSKRPLPYSFKVFHWVYLLFFFYIVNMDTTWSIGRYLCVLFPLFLHLALIFGDTKTQDQWTIKDLRFILGIILMFSININLYQRMLNGEFVG